MAANFCRGFSIFFRQQMLMLIRTSSSVTSRRPSKDDEHVHDLGFQSLVGLNLGPIQNTMRAWKNLCYTPSDWPMMQRGVLLSSNVSLFQEFRLWGANKMQIKLRVSDGEEKSAFLRLFSAGI